MNKQYKIFVDPFFYLFIFFCLLPIVPVLGSYISLGTELLIWFLYALSFNLLLGYTGLPSMGHGAFYGLGSYVTALTYLRFVDNSKNIFVPLIASTLIVGIVAYLIGFIIKNKRGIYFALLTVAFSQIFFVIAYKWTEVTGGELGITRLFRGQFMGINLSNPIRYYYFVLIIAFSGFVIIRKITQSPFGKTLQALKQNETRVQYLGYNTTKYCYSVIGISGAFAGLCGGLYCLLYSSVFADNMHWMKCGEVVLATLLGGGIVNFYGPIVGSTIFILAREMLSSIWDNWLLLYGLTFVFVILLVPTGLLGILEKIKEKKRI